MGFPRTRRGQGEGPASRHLGDVTGDYSSVVGYGCGGDFEGETNFLLPGECIEGRKSITISMEENYGNFMTSTIQKKRADISPRCFYFIGFLVQQCLRNITAVLGDLPSTLSCEAIRSFWQSRSLISAGSQVLRPVQCGPRGCCRYRAGRADPRSMLSSSVRTFCLLLQLLRPHPPLTLLTAGSGACLAALVLVQHLFGLHATQLACRSRSTLDQDLWHEELASPWPASSSADVVPGGWLSFLLAQPKFIENFTEETHSKSFQLFEILGCGGGMNNFDDPTPLTNSL